MVQFLGSDIQTFRSTFHSEGPIDSGRGRQSIALTRKGSARVTKVPLAVQALTLGPTNNLFQSWGWCLGDIKGEWHYDRSVKPRGEGYGHRW